MFKLLQAESPEGETQESPWCGGSVVLTPLLRREAAAESQVVANATHDVYFNEHNWIAHSR